MPISIEARIWLATHLLYPNSTQAFDVYQAIVSQSEKSIRSKDAQHLLVKLAQICEKIPPVNSALAFHVFENNQISEWRLIYKKTKKLQQIIFLGVLIFDLKIEQIAKAFKTTEDKIRFQFHQLFTKVVQQAPEIKMNYQFQFKKSSDSKVSYLFTNENLIDYSLGQLSAIDSEKVRYGLEIYPVLQKSEKSYRLIAKQINTLVAIHSSFKIVIPQPIVQVVREHATSGPSRFAKINQHKKSISISTISILVLLFVFIRPRWIENLSETSKREALVLLEVTKKSNSPIDSDGQVPINLNELPIQSESTRSRKEKVAAQLARKQVAASATNQTPEVAGLAKVEKQSPSAITAESTVSIVKPPMTNSASEVKKQGGLYRGVLVVTDLDEVSAKVRERIISLGGKKAGEVELGWKKSDNLGYYHFTVPQDNVEAINEYLAKFGEYRIDFENHPRLVQTGLKRFIIEVKQGD